MKVDKHFADIHCSTYSMYPCNAIQVQHTVEFNFIIIVTFLTYLGMAIVSGGGNRSTRQKPPPIPKSLAKFSHLPAGIRTQDFVDIARTQWKRLRSIDHEGRNE